ncbi:MAG: hypothetical protein AXA67_01020 [Methylothermaceae bacteria B42]|nr:MAG: hypothetical protein AXA67_01020 [Methylothermaceae bacteria B42]HHJ38216.1 copper resistance protein CopC [Methylothermaceae bacterium]
MHIKSLVFLVVLSLALGSRAYAHAVITHTTLQKTPPAAHQPAQVSLFFNSDIETSLSTIELVSKGDLKQPVQFRLGQKRGEILVELPPLPPGEYALQYKVFAADGHLTEDIIRFSIKE